MYNSVVFSGLIVIALSLAAIALANEFKSKDASSNNGGDFITSAQDQEMGAYLGGRSHGDGSSELSTDAIIVLSLIAAFVSAVLLYATYRAWPQVFSGTDRTSIGRQSRTNSMGSVGASNY